MGEVNGVVILLTGIALTPSGRLWHTGCRRGNGSARFVTCFTDLAFTCSPYSESFASIFYACVYKLDSTYRMDPVPSGYMLEEERQSPVHIIDSRELLVVAYARNNETVHGRTLKTYFGM